MSNTLTRTICIQLDGDGHDAALTATQRACNTAAPGMALVGWAAGITHTHTHTAQQRVDAQTRLTFGLRAQVAVCARAKAVAALKAVQATRRATCPQFGPRGSVRDAART